MVSAFPHARSEVPVVPAQAGNGEHPSLAAAVGDRHSVRMNMLGGIELGGTKIRVARGRADGGIVDTLAFPTGAPDDAFERIRAWFADGPAIAAIGVGAFGPIVVDARDADHGRLIGTPKPGWGGFDILAALRPVGVPMKLDTDVNTAGLAEQRLGALRGLECGVYLTIGTGIGGALVVGGTPVRGALHPEMGHLPLVRAAGDDAPSVCRFHASCAEGLASGPAIQRRFGMRLDQLPAGHPGHAVIGGYIGQLAASLVLTASPQRIAIGGGVSHGPGLHARAHAAMLETLNGYAVTAHIRGPGYVTPPALGDDAGLAGALLMAAG